MNVQEIIVKLMLAEDKTLPVFCWSSYSRNSFPISMIDLDMFDKVEINFVNETDED